MEKVPSKRRSAPRREGDPPVAKIRRAPRRSRSVADPPTAPPDPPTTPAPVEVNFAQFLEPKPKRSRSAARKKPAKTGVAKTKAKPARAKPARKAAKRKVAPPTPLTSPPIALPASGPAIALPDRLEPLVVAAAPPAMAAPHVPLARNRAPALYQTGGLLGLLSRWLDQSGRKVDQLLARRRKAKLALPRLKPAKAAPPVPFVAQPDEVERLRAENEALKRQLEAALAVNTAITS